MSPAGSPLLDVLREPSRMAALRPDHWDRLLREARAAGLLARLESLARRAGCLEALPGRVRDNIRGEQAWVAYHQLRIRRELREVRRALAREETEVPLLLLKGAAYMAAELPSAEGRLLSDLDLLVPRPKLEAVERVLLAHGWESRVEEEYDQRYYREWMHEIPPLVHPRRGVEVDIHHNLLALTGRYRIPAEKLWARARPLESGLLVLSPADMILHSAVHLVVSDELRGGLRDLFDIHQLYLHFTAEEPDFPRLLEERARELGVARPFWYVARAARALLHTPFPAELLDPPGDAPGPLVAALMHRLVTRVLRPRLPEAPRPAVAQWLLFVRSHWVRMPPGLLAAHLARKSWWRLSGRRRAH